VRKIAAIEALSRYGRAQPRMLGSINLARTCGRPPPSSIGSISCTASTGFLNGQAAGRGPADLKSRMTYAATMTFNTEGDDFGGG
jgi:hypothetical protein